MKPTFIDFEASSLAPNGWPIEVGVAWRKNGTIAVESKLIRPEPSWSMDDWHSESEAVHGIPRADLDNAEPAEDVAIWLREKLQGKLVVCDAPEFDQRWLDRLMQTIGGAPEIKIDDFDRVAWWAFSEMDGRIAPGRLHRVYETLVNEKTVHRAGDDAAKLARAWLAGCQVDE